jgi:predicted dehydrogenase
MTTTNGSSKQKMKVAIIGCGRIGEREAEAVVSIPDLSLAAVADIGPAFRDKAVRMGAKYECDVVHDWRHLIERRDVSIVVVATPNSFHREISVEAMRRGKHVLVEKPLATTLAEAEEMVATAEAEGVKLMTNFNHRRHDHNFRAKELLQQGVIGRPVFVRGRIGHGRFVLGPSPAGAGRFQCVNNWYMDAAAAGGGTLIDNGVHLLDLAAWYMDEEFVSAHGSLSHNLDICDRAPDGTLTVKTPSECEDNGFGLLTTRDGRIASIQSSWTQWQGYLHVEIFGTNGWIIVNNDQIQGTVTYQMVTRHGEPSATTTEVPALLKPDPSWRLQLEELAAAVREDRQPSPNGYDGLRAVRMVHALYRSAASGKTETVDTAVPYGVPAHRSEFMTADR